MCFFQIEGNGWVWRLYCTVDKLTLKIYRNRTWGFFVQIPFKLVFLWQDRDGMELCGNTVVALLCLLYWMIAYLLSSNILNLEIFYFFQIVLNLINL